jgi:hypothetical protein
LEGQITGPPSKKSAGKKNRTSGDNTSRTAKLRYIQSFKLRVLPSLGAERGIKGFMKESDRDKKKDSHIVGVLLKN